MRQILKWSALSAFALVIVAAVLLIFADEACRLPRHRMAMDIGKAAGCTEFWLHRYQSAWIGLIGAWATLNAAVIAWTAVQRQIFHTTRAAMEQTAKQSRLNAASLEAQASLLREIVSLSDYDDGTGFRNIDRAFKAQNRRYFPLKLLAPEIFGEIAFDYNLVAERASTMAQAAMAVRNPDVDEDIRLRIDQLEALAPKLDAEVHRLRELANAIELQVARGIRDD